MKLNSLAMTAVLASLVGCALPTPTRLRLDAQLAKLCAKDAGVTIYETVPRPRSAFNEYGHIKPILGQFDRLYGDDLVYEIETNDFVPGPNDGMRPRLLRHETRMHRRSDGKLLGKEVSYARIGGDVMNPGQPTVKSCPPRGTPDDLLARLFVRVEAE